MSSNRMSIAALLLAVTAPNVSPKATAQTVEADRIKSLQRGNNGGTTIKGLEQLDKILGETKWDAIREWQ